MPSTHFQKCKIIITTRRFCIMKCKLITVFFLNLNCVNAYDELSTVVSSLLCDKRRTVSNTIGLNLGRIHLSHIIN